jgi:hypothetical protein
MAARGNAFSRNPNVCASCSSMADGMDDRMDDSSMPPVLESVPLEAPKTDSPSVPTESAAAEQIMRPSGVPTPRGS